MKTLCMLVCATLLAGCTSATIQPSEWPAQQSFGYPQPGSLRLSQPNPAAVPVVGRPAEEGVAASSETVRTPAVAIVDRPEAPYDEAKDPMMRALVARTTRPADSDLVMRDGKLVLPPTAKLDVIDIREVSGALENASKPAS